MVAGYYRRQVWRSWVIALAGSKVLAVIVCAFGRGLDFATTWIALHQGLAEEAKPGASHLLSVIGPSHGLLIYELWVTTPAIFIGCYMAGRLYQARPLKIRRLSQSSTENLLLHGVGAISFLVAAWNLQFLIH